MNRGEVIAAISSRLGERHLIWAGLRGDDVEPLTDLPQLSDCFSIIGAYASRDSVNSVALEDISHRRVDLEVWDIDNHLDSREAIEFRRGLLESLVRPSALVPYRPSRFLSAVCFARRDTCWNLGLFGGHQSAFEHKPWVESAVAQLGLPHVPWRYVADEDQLHTRELIRDLPIMLRRSRTSGGEGIVRVDEPSQISEQWPRGDEAFVSVAPFIDGGIPVNIGGTVWKDGVTLRHPSVQLIGIPGCVSRPFGYCGNDFGAARDLDATVVDQIEDAGLRIGAWLRSHGYLGTFGLDFLVRDGVAIFMEVNPRFQGSTHLSCRIAAEHDEPCLMTEHVAAMLGMEAPEHQPLRSVVMDLPSISHIVVHWVGSDARRLDPIDLTRAMVDRGSAIRIDVVTKPSVVTEAGAVASRITVPCRVTEAGFDLRDPWASIIRDWSPSSVPNPTELADPAL